MSRGNDGQISDTRPRRGARVLLAVKATLSLLFAGTLAWVLPAAFVDDPAPMPGWLWALGAVVPLVGLALTWRREERVPELFFFIGAAAVLVGLGGAVWESRVAPVLGAATLVGLVLAPRGRAS